MEPDAQLQPRTSKLAIISLVLTPLSCCSLAGLVPIVLAGIAIIRIRLNPMLQGMAIAVLSIVLNLGLTAFTTVWVAPKLMEVVDQVFGLMLKGPASAMRAGQDGNIDGFLAIVDRSGADAPDAEEAKAFLATVTERFGTVEESVPQDTGRGAPPPGARDTKLDYMLKVSKGGTTSSYKCEVVWRLANDADELDVKAISIRIMSDEGDLVFPRRAARSAEGSAK